ncbi:MAG: hypothetical protein LQ337_005069 [Flavoplaca oasis]|nr:MAG: hypothetical protein LQ337_005069 [Flavoplaca oasis]
MTYQPEPLAVVRTKDLTALRALYAVLADRYVTVVDERDEADKRLKAEREKAQKTIEDARAAATRKTDRMQAKIRELESELALSDRKLASASDSGPELKKAESKIASLESRLEELKKILIGTQEDLQSSQDDQSAKEDKLDSQPPALPATTAPTPQMTAPVPKGPYLAQPRIPPPQGCYAHLPHTWGPNPRQWMTIAQQERFKVELAE